MVLEQLGLRLIRGDYHVVPNLSRLTVHKRLFPRVALVAAPDGCRAIILIAVVGQAQYREDEQLRLDAGQRESLAAVDS